MLSLPHEIRFEAGLFYNEIQVDLYDIDRTEAQVGDGSATVFYTEHAPIVDRNDGTAADVDDVTVWVNGVEADVASIDAEQGQVTLTSAPAVDAEIKINYTWSSVNDDKIEEYGEEANATIFSGISGVYLFDASDADINPDFAGSKAETFLKGLEKRLAAAYLLQVMYTEENDSLHKQGVEMERRVMSQLTKIQNGTIKLFDSEGAELARSGVQSMGGYPNDETEPEEDASKFEMGMEL